MYTLIQTAKLNGIDPQAWLADVLASINDTISRTSMSLSPGIGRPDLTNWRHEPAREKRRIQQLQ
jgi:hypothetical protein